MNNRISIVARNIVVIAVFAITSLCSCVNYLDEKLYRNNFSQTAKIAIDYYESQKESYTRSNNQDPSEQNPYVLGNFSPDWQSEEVVSTEERSYSDFDLTKENRFFLLPNIVFDNEAVELYSNFVSIIDNEDGKVCQYIATYIPAFEYIATYQQALQEERFSCCNIDDFSGYILYSMLSGHHVAVYRYHKGKCIDGAFLYNKRQSQSENIEDFLHIIDGLSIGIVPNNGTRTDDLIFGGEIEMITIVYNKMFPIIVINDYLSPSETETTLDDEILEPTIIDMSGGGGAGIGSDEEESSDLSAQEVMTTLFMTDSLSQTESSALEEMLSEIVTDCLGQSLCRSLINGDQYIHINIDTNREKCNFGSKDGYWIINMKYEDRSDALLHEMIHAYQAQSLGAYKYNQTSINLEVQAYLTQYLYLLRSNSQALKDFGFITPGAYVVDLGSCFDCSYNLINGVSIDTVEKKHLHTLIALMMHYFNNNPKDDIVTKVDPDQTIEDFLSFFETLGKDC